VVSRSYILSSLYCLKSVYGKRGFFVLELASKLKLDIGLKIAEEVFVNAKNISK